MNEKEIVKTIMDERMVTNASLAARLELSRQTVWDRLMSPKSKNMTIAVLMQMLRALDYKIQIVPRSSRLPDGGYEID